MNPKRILFFTPLIGVVILLVTASMSTVTAKPTLTASAELGKLLFFDKNLSINENQACAACHGPTAGWTWTEEVFNAHGAVYEGSFSRVFLLGKLPD